MGVRARNVRDLVRQAIILGLRRCGERIFNTSQNTAACFVPVDRGTLKHSGYTKPLPNGIEIGYTAPYAAKVHFGGPAVPFKGTQTVLVRAHRRRGGANVPAHSRTYINKRIIGFRPKFSKFERGPLIYRVLKEEPAREGTFFLSRAVTQEIVRLSEDIGFYLKRLEQTGSL